MKNRRIVGIVIVALVVCLSGVAAHAQDPMMSKFDIFTGYSFTSHHQENIADANLHGLGLGFVYNMHRNVGLEANLNWYAGDSTPFFSTSTRTQVNLPPSTGGFISQPQNFSDTSHSHQKLFKFLVGPKLTHHIGAFQLFTHLLVGAVRSRENAFFTNSSSQVSTFAGPPVVTVTDTDNGVEVRSGKGTGFGGKFGGGVDYVRGHWGWRILQIDYQYAHGRVKGTETNSSTFKRVCTPASSGSCSGNNFTSASVDTGPIQLNQTANGLDLSTGLTLRFW